MSPPEDWPRLVSLAVHELRSPLNVIGGYLRMLESGRTGALDEAQIRLVKLALVSWTRAIDLVSDLSELGKLESGARQPAGERVDLDGVLDDAVAAFRPPPDDPIGVERRGVQGLVVRGDGPRLRRAVTACLTALARELVGERHLVLDAGTETPATVTVIVGDEAGARLDRNADAWGVLDEWRGGVGLELPLARRVVERAGGRMCSPIGARLPVIRIDLQLDGAAGTSSGSRGHLAEPFGRQPA